MAINNTPPTGQGGFPPSRPSKPYPPIPPSPPESDTAAAERQRLIRLAERGALDLMAENQMPSDVQEFARRHKLETFINGLWVQAFKEGVRAGAALTKGSKE